MPGLAELVFEDLNKQLAAVKADVRLLELRTERAETASGVLELTLAAAPLAVNGAKGGDMLFISDGRKSGEGAGAGTGLIAYYNPATDSWYRPADDTAVAI